MTDKNSGNVENRQHPIIRVACEVLLAKIANEQDNLGAAPKQWELSPAQLDKIKCALDGLDSEDRKELAQNPGSMLIDTAIAVGSVKLLNMAFEYGAALSLKKEKDHSSHLQQALYGAHNHPIIREILRRGGDIYEVDDGNCDAVARFVGTNFPFQRQEQIDTLECFFEHGADPVSVVALLAERKNHLDAKAQDMIDAWVRRNSDKNAISEALSSPGKTRPNPPRAM